MTRYILIDGSGYIFRAYYALPPMTRSSDNLPVNAVYGFCNMLWKLVMSLEDGDIPVCVFDAARKNWRSEIYPEYKANRLETPAELAPQFAYIRKAAEAFGLPCSELVGFEADDIIATYARQASVSGEEAVIYSSDKDLMQLLQKGVSIFDPLKNKVVDEAAVFEKFGVAPALVPDVQALIGDSSDNIPGVMGIGPKTAAELINKYGSLETLLAQAYNIKQDKRRETLMNSRADAEMSKRLATLDANVPVPPLSSYTGIIVDSERLKGFFEEMEFKSLAAKVGKKDDVALTPKQVRGDEVVTCGDVAPKGAYTLVRDVEVLREWVLACKAAGRFAVDTETMGLNALADGIVGISLSYEEGKACYIPLAHTTSAAPAFDWTAELRGLLEDPEVLKIGHNIKYDMHIFAQSGIRVAPVADTMVMSYVLDGAQHPHNMDYLAENFLNYRTIHFDEVVGKDKLFANVPLEMAVDYAAEDADITLRLYNLLSKRLMAEDTAGVFAKIDNPLVPVLFDMEEAGIKIDVRSLAALSEQFGVELAKLEGQIFDLAGERFNILSPMQLGEVLFDKMGLVHKGGKRSTDVSVLSDMEHPIAKLVLEYRGLAKLKGTYSDALPKQILPRDGRVHTNYFQAGTSTGRLSSNDPNLQNIPIRTELGQAIRAAFIAEPGFKIVSADYSQVELRVLAHYAKVVGLREAFLAGEDIHSATAMKVFGVADAEHRRRAKAINFGIVYGISSYGLAAQLGISRGEAQTFIDNYFKAYPEILTYMQETKEFALANGYVETMFGRKCFIPMINNPRLRQMSERAAINAPIQGTAADIIKLAMERLAGLLPDGVKMLLQVHDELVFEVRDELVPDVSALVKKEMESVVAWEIPLLADVGVGENWRAAH